METFVTLITDTAKPTIHNVPLLGFAEAGASGHFDDGGFPVGKDWEEIALPAVTDEHAYALEISGDAMQPAYRDGDVIIVSPASAGAQRRPRGGQDQGRRGHGQGAQAQEQQDRRAQVA